MVITRVTKLIILSGKKVLVLEPSYPFLILAHGVVQKLEEEKEPERLELAVA
jgi:hypothetical protein